MAKYILVKDRTQLLLGPIDWKQRFIQSELDDLEIPGKVPPVEIGYIDLGDGYEMFPIVSSNGDAFDPVWEELVGPKFTYEDNAAHESYTIRNRPLHFIKDTLINALAAERYRREVAGFTMNVRGVDVYISTAREDRQQFLEALATIGDGYISWKFNTGFVNILKSDIEAIVEARKNYIQQQFTWEKNIYEAIKVATTIEQLKEIKIVEQE